MYMNKQKKKQCYIMVYMNNYTNKRKNIIMLIYTKDWVHDCNSQGKFAARKTSIHTFSGHKHACFLFSI